MKKDFRNSKKQQNLAQKRQSAAADTFDEWPAKDQALLDAVKEGKEERARQLLLDKQFADLEIQDKKRDGTSLFWACVRGYEDIMEMLIWYGALVNCINAQGCFPLHGAADAGHLNIIRILLKWGADVNAVNKNGDTALHIACYRGHEHIVQYLLSKTLTTSLLNSCGKTALQVAEAQEHWSIVKLIKQQQQHPKDDKEEKYYRRRRCEVVADLDGGVASRTRSSSVKRKSVELDSKVDNLPKTSSRKLTQKEDKILNTQTDMSKTLASGSAERLSSHDSWGKQTNKQEDNHTLTNHTTRKNVNSCQMSGDTLVKGTNSLVQDDIDVNKEAIGLDEVDGSPPCYSTLSTEYVCQSLPLSPFRLQSMPYGFPNQLNDLNK